LLKLFDACKLLRFENGGKLVTAMVSDEGEEYKFVMPVRPEGNVEDWMGRVDAEMKRTLHYYTKEAIFQYAREDRIDWIRKQIGMVSIIGTQVWWTFSVEDVFKRVKNDKYAMKNELQKESEDIDNLINLIRTNIEDKLRKAINCLIILDVHQRDIVDMFVRDSKLSSDEFDWQKQLRFYWDPQADDISVKQCTGVLTYCYEYMGLNTRLVITPLTDRCVMTLTTALTFFLGGAPAGPAGTGKTETVRDLAKSLALRCLVTCCGETLDSTALGAIFSGLIQNGFWGCFDEFNRINREVLSVVSTQIKTIQVGLAKKVKMLGFMETDLPLIHTIGIYITMNPGYAGRSELPDNLKALFRPVTMVVPELIMICENMLMSEGFNTASNLSVKMVTLYKLTKEQLSKQYHYEFGLRPIKSVLVQAGFLKRNYPDMPEDAVLMRALRDMNMPKFVFEDEPLFKGLL
jgi:dynein heavy chain